MKNGILLMLAVCAAVMLGGCNEDLCRPTAWIMGGSDVDAADNPVTGRVGVNADGVEFGLESHYEGGHMQNQAYGAYILAELPPTLAGTPYMGYHALLADDDIDERHGPILGTIIQITPRVATVIEGQYVGQADEDNQYRASAGVRVKF
jgi:hypothetical protein